MTRPARSRLRNVVVGALGAWLLAAGATAQTVPAGAALFGAQCAACHQPDGKGQPGMAPALAGVFAPVLAREDGRRYLVQVLLNGLSGRIVSQGQVFVGAMAAQTHLSDEELASVANHLARDLNGSAEPPFTAADFQRGRGDKTSHKALRDLRATVMP